MIIKIIITVVVLILIRIRIIWSQNSNDCNNDHDDYATLLIITILIIGGYSNEKKIAFSILMITKIK